MPWISLFFACGGPPPAPPQVSGPADAAAAADLDGDGGDDPVLVSAGVARWPGNEADLGGDLQAAAREAPGPDGRQALLLGTGASRGLPDAPARVWRLTDAGAELLWERRGLRNQITDLRVVDGRVWVATFIDRMTVAGGWLEGAELQIMLREGLATRQLPLEQDRAVVGRIYGDTPKSDGDLRLMRDGASPEQLPSLRGVRALASADLNGDGAPELLVGDGWHFAYAAQGVARVRVLEGPDWQRGRTIASFDGEYSVREIEPSGDAILATGSSRVHLLKRDEMGWADHDLGPISETGRAAILRGPWGAAALLPGDPAKVAPFPD